MGPMRGMPGMGRGMMRGGPPGFDLQRLAQDDPEMHQLVQQDFELEEKSFELSTKIRSAKAEEREKLRGELKVTVDDHFKVRQARRELQLKRMEEELKRLRAAIESRNQSRDEIIAKRLTELIGEEKDLEF
jgi:hypothetical protein